MRSIASRLSFILALIAASPAAFAADPPAAADAPAAPDPPPAADPPASADSSASIGAPTNAAPPPEFLGGLGPIIGAPDPRLARRIRHPAFIGISAGPAFTTMSMQNVIPKNFVSGAITFLVGYTVEKHFTLSLEFMTTDKKVSRGGPKAKWDVPRETQADDDCMKFDSCKGPVIVQNAVIGTTALFFGQLSPRIDFTPFGEHGFFVSAAAGVAAFQLLTLHPGVGAAFHTGYRWRVAKILDLGLEATVQGQLYQEGNALTLSALGTLRPHI